MKIRITGKSLAKAQVGQQTGEPTSITVNGIVYTPQHPDWEKVKKEKAAVDAEAAAISQQVNSHFGIKKPESSTIPQATSSFPIAPTFPNKVNPIPAAPASISNTTIPNVQATEEPPKVDLSGFKPPVIAGYKEEEPQAPVETISRRDARDQAKAQKAQAEFNAKYPNAPVNQTTWQGLDEQVAQRADPLGYEVDQRIKNDPKYARKFARSVNGNLDKFKTIGAASNALTGAIYTAGALTNFIDNKNKQNDFNSYMRDQQMSDNLFPVKQGSRGDYVQTGTSFGQFRPDQMVVNKGMFAQYGGSLINDTQTMKIRIINGPEKMAYGGQAKWSLDLGDRNIDSDMADNDYDSVSNTLREVPREEANIEAEGGETVYGDIDGDGGLEHMKINGKRHTQGGVPLNVPEGSFVFSDTKKMKIKSKTVLEMFGLNPKSDGYTPAEIAKRYDINKYKAVLEDPTSDDVSKSTAELMVKNYKKKLAYLALIQESMKNFPQGIPDVAREGGLPENVLQEVEESISQGAGEQEESNEEEDTEIYDDVEEQMGQPNYQVGGPYTGGINSLNPLGLTAEQLAVIQQAAQSSADYRQRALEASKNMPLGWTRTDDGRLVPNRPPEADVVTTGTGQFADSSDPEYATFLGLLDKYDTKTVRGKRYINRLSGQDAKEFARLATKFGFNRAGTDNQAGYSVMQGSSPGYTFSNGTKNAGFFGGYTPEMYERLVAEDALGADKVANMSPLDIRKEYFKQLGVNTAGLTDAQLNDPKKLYTNKKFFKESFYPKFVGRFAKDSFRPEMGDDLQIGAEHYDSFRATPKTYGKELFGYICKGLDANNKPIIETTSYMDNAALLAAGASTDPKVAAAKCAPEGTTPNKPGGGKPKDPRFGYMTPDVVNMAAAALNTPNKYLPYMAPYTATLPEPTFKDPNRELAANAEQANIMTQGLANFAGPQAFMANSSAVQGKALANAADIMGRYQNDNVGIANYFAPLRSDIMNKQKLYNAERVNELWKANAIANQQYDNSKNAYRNNLARTFGQAWNNRMNLGLTNAVNPMYNIDPLSGRSFFINGYGPDKLAAYASARNVGAIPDWASVGQNYTEAQKYLPGLTVSDFLRHQSGRTSSVDTDGDGLPNKTTTIKQG
jgi:hypothetical protein